MLRPLTDRILIKPEPVPDRTESGLHLVQHWKPENLGIVIGVPERCDTNCPDCGGRVFVTPQVKVGDTVLFSFECGQDITVDGERHLLMREADILAVWEPQETL